MDLVHFERFTQLAAKPHKVYLRTSWADPWVHVPYLYCDNCTSCVAPSMSSANLSWRFGNAIQPDKTWQQWYSRLTGKFRALVRIEYETHPLARDGVLQTDPYNWVGTIETEGAQLEGVRDGFTLVDGVPVPVQRESGHQAIGCLGLEHTLNRCPIGHSFWYDSKGVLHRAERAFEFNAPDASGRGLGNWGAGGLLKVFDSQPYTEKDTLAWSTRKIVRYLQAFGPKDALGGLVFPLLLLDEFYLPDNDRPVLDPTGLTLWEALCTLIARTRMLGFYLRYTPAQGGNPEFVALQPYSLAGANQTFGEIEVPANPNQVRIDFDSDPDIVSAGIKGSSVPAVDQFVLRGARRTSTCSLSYADGTLGNGWPTLAAEPDEADYKTAGSADPDYAAMVDKDFQDARNLEIRGSHALHDVYRFFTHPGSDWDQQAADGEGGQKQPVFPDGNDPFLVNPRELFILPCVLLEEGSSYVSLGSLSEPIPPPIVAPNANNRQPPLCFVKVPNESSPDRYWIEGAKLGMAANLALAQNSQENRRFSIRTEVPQMSYGLYLHVEGQEQHAIAYSDFVPLVNDRPLGRYDWKEFVVTVSFEDDRYCEGVWPPLGMLAALFPAGQHIRQQILYAGDAYRQDWCVPGTVVSVNPHNGQLQRNASGGWIADDSAKLLARARQIHAYFSQPRRALTFSSGRINTALELGDYIVERGDLNREAIGAVITQITINSPEGGEIPQITYESSFLELDALQI